MAGEAGCAGARRAPAPCTNYVYRVRYGDAQSIGCSINALYTPVLPDTGYGGRQWPRAWRMSGIGGMYGGGMGGGGLGGGMYGWWRWRHVRWHGWRHGRRDVRRRMAVTAVAMAAVTAAGGCMAAADGGGIGSSTANAGAYRPNRHVAPCCRRSRGRRWYPAAAGGDLTGNYLGNAPPQDRCAARVPRVVANPFNNTLLIQATPQEYENILTLLKDLDIPPRQVLIEAKIYSVDLTHAFSSDVHAKLQQLSGSTSHSFLADFGGGVTNLSGAALVGKSRELLAAVQLQETESRAKVLSAPSVIATDSIPAIINVGAVGPHAVRASRHGRPAGGNSLFANSISNVSTGVTLNILARVTPSGIVTMIINQEVSDPTPTTTSSIQSPSFAKKSDSDPDHRAGRRHHRDRRHHLETNTLSQRRNPGAESDPDLGALFGYRSYSKDADRADHLHDSACHLRQQPDVGCHRRAEGPDQALRKDVKE